MLLLSCARARPYFFPLVSFPRSFPLRARFSPPLWRPARRLVSCPPHSAAVLGEREKGREWRRGEGPIFCALSLADFFPLFLSSALLPASRAAVHCGPPLGSTRPRPLSLFCCAPALSAGRRRAGGPIRFARFFCCNTSLVLSLFSLSCHLSLSLLLSLLCTIAYPLAHGFWPCAAVACPLRPAGEHPPLFLCTRAAAGPSRSPAVASDDATCSAPCPPPALAPSAPPARLYRHRQCHSCLVPSFVSLLSWFSLSLGLLVSGRTPTDDERARL